MSNINHGTEQHSAGFEGIFPFIAEKRKLTFRERVDEFRARQKSQRKLTNEDDILSTSSAKTFTETQQNTKSTKVISAVKSKNSDEVNLKHSIETQYKVARKKSNKQENKHTETELSKYAPEFIVEQIQEEPIEIISNEYIKQEVLEEEPQAHHQQSNETNAIIDIDATLLKKPQTMECIIQKKYILDTGNLNAAAKLNTNAVKRGKYKVRQKPSKEAESKKRVPRIRKTNSDKCRDYRLRKKLAQEAKAKKLGIEQIPRKKSKKEGEAKKLVKSNSVRCREYRWRKKFERAAEAKNPDEPMEKAMTSAERTRKFREKSKQLQQLVASENATGSSSAALNPVSAIVNVAHAESMLVSNSVANQLNENTCSSASTMAKHLKMHEGHAQKPCSEHVLTKSKDLTQLEYLRQKQLAEESFLERLTIAKCLNIISLAKQYENITIANITNLDIHSIPVIQKYEKHILKICAYVPNAIRCITPNALNNIIAITEILKEFMQRLSCHNIKLTDKELMLKAKLLTRVFCVTGMQIDENWAQFFRKNFTKSNSIEKPTEKLQNKDLYVHDILNHVQDTLDSAVVVRFNQHLKKFSNNLILTYSGMFSQSENETLLRRNEKIIAAEQVKELRRNENVIAAGKMDLTDTSEKQIKELGITKKIAMIKKKLDLEKYTINKYANEAVNEVHASCINESMKTLGNDDPNDMIEIYAVIDEDDNENDGDATQNAMYQESELILGKLKNEPVDETQNKKVQEKDLILVQIKQEPVDETQNEMYQESELILGKIKKEPVDDIRNSSEQEHELMLDKIKHEPTEAVDETRIDQEDDKLSLVKIKDEPFEELQAMQVSIQNSSMEHMELAIQQDSTETNFNINNNDTYEIFMEVDEDDADDFGNLMNFDEQTEANVTKACETQYEEHPEYCLNQDNKNMQARLHENSPVITFHEIKKKYIEMHANDNCVEHLKSKTSTNRLYSDKNQHNIDQVVVPEAAPSAFNVKQKLFEPAQHEKKPSTKLPIKATTSKILRNFLLQPHKRDQRNIRRLNLTEARALQIGTILRLQPCGKLNCEVLKLDPIICTYMHIFTDKPKLFNESLLLISFQIVLGKELYDCQNNYVLQLKDIFLYRQLLALVYSTKYELSQLVDIMMGIFDESEIKKLLINTGDILEQWRAFFKKHFISMLYRKAMYEMLFEYRTRFDSLVTIFRQLVPISAKDILEFLRADRMLSENWQTGYNAYIKKKANKKPNKTFGVYTTNDLSLNRIYADIKEQLPQLVVEYLEKDCLNMKLDTDHDKAATEKCEIEYINSAKALTEEPPKKKQKIVRFIHNFASSQTLDSVENSAYSKTSTEMELQAESINTHGSHINAAKTLMDFDAEHAEAAKEKCANECINSVGALAKGSPKKKQNIVRINYEPESKKALEYGQSVDKSGNSKTSTEMELQAESINTHASHINAAEFCEVACIKQIQPGRLTNLSSVLDSALPNDPIISKYLYLSKIDAVENLPLYNEIHLRRAFLEVFAGNNIGQYCECQTQDLLLYRKLLVLYYSRTKFLLKIANIMTCYSEATIKEHIKNAAHIIKKWQIFFKTNLSRLLYKQAIYEMLYVYTKLYLQKNKNISDETLNQTAAKIQKYLRCHIKLPELWLEHFSELFRKRFVLDKCTNRSELFNSVHTKLNTSNTLTGNHFDFYSMYEFAKNRINSLVHDTVLPILKFDADCAVIAFPTNNYTSYKAKQANEVRKAAEIFKQKWSLLENNAEDMQQKKQHEIVEKNFKNPQKAKNSENSKISTAIEQSSSSNNTPCSDVNGEMAIIKKLKTCQTSELTTTLHNDPIIAKYLSLTYTHHNLVNKGNLPVYSEQTLTTAFEEVFTEYNIGQYSMCQPEGLLLYRKLLLLYYARTKYFSSKVNDIMICFDENVIKEHLSNFSNIIMEWRIFFEKNLSRLLYTQAIYEMLYEYTKRYLHNEKHISDADLIQKAKQIQRYLHCHIILPESWLQYFSSLFKKRFVLLKCTQRSKLFKSVHIMLNSTDTLPGKSLGFYSIYLYVESRLNYLVTDTLSGVIRPENAEILSENSVAEYSSVAAQIIKTSKGPEVLKESDEISELKQQLTGIDMFIKDQLNEDPIIKHYFQIVNANKPKGIRFPRFNANVLCSAFKHVFQNSEPATIAPGGLDLYTQLILLKYSEHCSTIAELAEIMRGFTQDAILQHLKNYLSIKRNWHNFNEIFLSVPIYEETLYEMLYEYSTRYLRTYSKIEDKHLQKISEEIKAFFGFVFELPNYWLSYFRDMLLERLTIDTKKYDGLDIRSKNYLKLENIYEDIKSRLNVVAVEKQESFLKLKKLNSRIAAKPETLVKDNIAAMEQVINSGSGVATHRGIAAQDSDDNANMNS